MKVVFTFDDGLLSHYEHAMPILQEHNFSATFFITGRRGLWKNPRFRSEGLYEEDASWDQIRELHVNGFEIGNHTLSHPVIPNLSKERILDEVNMLNDFLASQQIPEPISFCYPGYGSNEEVARILKEETVIKFARSGYQTPLDQKLHGPCNGGGTEEEIVAARNARKKLQYYMAGETNPHEIFCTGIMNDWYGLKYFIEDVEQIPEGGVGIFTLHGISKPIRLENFRKCVQYLADRGHMGIAMRDLDQ